MLQLDSQLRLSDIPVIWYRYFVKQPFRHFKLLKYTDPVIILNTVAATAISAATSTITTTIITTTTTTNTNTTTAATTITTAITTSSNNTNSTAKVPIAIKSFSTQKE